MDTGWRGDPSQASSLSSWMSGKRSKLKVNMKVRKKERNSPNISTKHLYHEYSKSYFSFLNIAGRPIT
jgi:hypothetical protein